MMEKYRQQNIRVFGQPLPKTDLLVGGLLLLGFGLLLVSVGWLIADYEDGVRSTIVEPVAESPLAKTSPAAEPAEAAASEGAVADDPLAALLDFHISATGLDRVEAYRAEGRYNAGATEMSFAIMARRPNLHRQILTHDNVTVEFGYDGSELWLDQSHDIVDTSNAELRTLNRALVILENSIPYLAWSYASGMHESDLTLFPNHRSKGRTYAVVRSYGLLGLPVYHYIDRETGQEAYRTADIPLGSGIRHVEVRYDYGSPDPSSPLPAAYSLYLDRELFCRASFSDIAVNGGLPSFLFKRGELL